jgi:hypothetical protein
VYSRHLLQQPTYRSRFGFRSGSRSKCPDLYPYRNLNWSRLENCARSRSAISTALDTGELKKSVRYEVLVIYMQSCMDTAAGNLSLWSSMLCQQRQRQKQISCGESHTPRFIKGLRTDDRVHLGDALTSQHSYQPTLLLANTFTSQHFY